MKPFSCAVWVFFLYCILQTNAECFAQYGYSVQFKDSILATDSAEWSTNDIFIKNERQEKLHLMIQFTLTGNWQLAGKDSTSVFLEPGETRVIPVNLIGKKAALSEWVPVKIQFYDVIQKNSQIRQFVISVPPKLNFSVTGKLDEFFVYEQSREIDIEIQVKNTGNKSDDYSISVRNEILSLNKEVRKKLKPGETYNFLLNLKFSDLMLKSFQSESIRFYALNSQNISKSKLVQVINISSKAKMNPSPYHTIPFQLRTGLMFFGNSFTYFFGASGSLLLNKGKKIDYRYQSKQMGVANTIEQNPFLVEYKTKRWNLQAGQLSDVSAFFTFGKGFSATYTGRDRSEFNVQTIFRYKNSPFTSNLFSTHLKHFIRKSEFKHTLAVSSTPNEERLGLVFLNDLNIVSKKNLNLKLNLNIGQHHYMFDLPQNKTEKAGLALGYSASYSLSRFMITSEYFKADGDFPGVLAGSLNQNHSVMWQVLNSSLTVYYRQNKTNPVNLFIRDTVFNTNFFELDFEQYGMDVTLPSGKNTLVTIGGGKYKQVGLGRTFLPSAVFGNLSFNYRKGRDFRVRLNSINGFGNSVIDKQRNNIWISRSNLLINYKTLGLSAFYIRAPILRAVTGRDSLRMINETINISPFAGFTMFKVLRGELGYNFAKSLFDNSLATFANVNITYENKRNGLLAQLAGNIPISNTSSNFSNLANNSVMLTVVKDFNLPVLFKKKYFQFKVLVYLDENLNGKRDEQEKLLKDMKVTIGNRVFLTDRFGMIHYRNVKKGIYTLDLINANAPRGYIPRGGAFHIIELNKDSIIEIGYDKGKVISGKVTAFMDTLSGNLFTVEKLKVTVTDTLGNTFRTLTNVNGEYFVNVPPGYYKVSLNPEAFTNDIKPSQLFFMIQTRKENDEEIVNFEIHEKKRQIRYFKKQ